jgi:hypothetical protein
MQHVGLTRERVALSRECVELNATCHIKETISRSHQERLT